MLKIQPNSKVIDSKNESSIETLDWVGISSMSLPIKYKLSGESNRTAAQIELAVSLDKGEYKGIDMAELFFNAQEFLADRDIDFTNLRNLTEILIQKHKDRTLSARVELAFDIFTKKQSLRSKELGWISYPVSLEFINSDSIEEAVINFELTYASTCPCSESASRKENIETFNQFFKASTNPQDDFEAWYLDQANSFAYPHAQKSKANFSLKVDSAMTNPVDFALSVIQELEELIQTSVHAAVREEDEAAFTTKMGENLIFIEDAAKIFKAYVKSKDEIKSSAVQLLHFESIHPHNAKVFFTT